MLSNLKLNGSLVCAASRRDLSAISGTRVLGGRPASLATGFKGSRGSRMAGVVMGDSAVFGVVVAGAIKRERAERPTWAPVAGAWAHAYVVASGAGAQANEAEDASFTATDVATIRTQQTKRAFRGLEPWRDPA